jgi:hypothetical protein
MPRHFTRWPTVEGYPARLSYAPGEVVSMHCSSRASTFHAEVTRVGARRTTVWRQADIGGSEHPVPDDAAERGCHWPVTFTIPLDPHWPSGYYEVALIADAEPGTTEGGRPERRCEHRSEAMFVIRAPQRIDRRQTALLVLSTNTYAAYNQWGGRCLYSGASQVSFARPLERGYLRRPSAPDEVVYDGRVASIDPGDTEHVRLQRYLADNDYPLWCASGGWHNWERRFVAWAERAGFALDLAVSGDLHADPTLLDGHRLLWSVGHDEYWSWEMRDAVDAFVQGAGRWAILSGNTCFWQVRYEDDGTTMVCHKGRAATQDPVVGTDREHLLTGMWSTPAIGRPEAESTGLSFTRGGYARVGQATPRSSGGFTVHRPDHPLFAGTGLRAGDVLGAAGVVVGYEVDGCELALQDGRPVAVGSEGTPTGLDVLATAPARLLSITADHCEAPTALWASVEPPGDLEEVATVLFGSAAPEHTARLAHTHAVLAAFDRGRGRVVHVGSTDWAYGLDRDPFVQQVTANAWAWLLADG